MTDKSHPLHCPCDWFERIDSKLDSLGESTAELKTNMKTLIGNGQPGRVQQLEKTQAQHGRLLYLIIGGIILLNVLAKFIR